MPRLFVSIRDLDDPDGRPIVASTDEQVISGVGRLIADRLRARAIEKFGPDTDHLINLTLASRRPRGSNDNDDN